MLNGRRKAGGGKCQFRRALSRDGRGRRLLNGRRSLRRPQCELGPALRALERTPQVFLAGLQRQPAGRALELQRHRCPGQ